MPNVNVSDWTKNQLERIKDEEDHKSLDSVIRSLILRQNKNDDQHKDC